jgi:hypothetical protein
MLSKFHGSPLGKFLASSLMKYLSNITMPMASFTLCSCALCLPWSKAYATYNVKWLYISVRSQPRQGTQDKETLSDHHPIVRRYFHGRFCSVWGCSQYERHDRW